MLSLFFIMAFIWLIVEEVIYQGVGGFRKNVKDVVDLINSGEYKLIDIRSRSAFITGHITSSVNMDVPMQKNEFGKLETYRGKKIILICANGRESVKLANKLKNAKFCDVCFLGGGIVSWKQSGMPLVV